MTSSFTRLLRLTGLLVLCLVAAGSLNTAFGIGADCPTVLDGCYKSCQAVEPTPAEACFYKCDSDFRECIGLATSAYSVNAQR